MDMNDPGKERRKFKRTPVSFLVYYKINSPLVIKIQVGDKMINALAADISEGGIAIMTDYELPPVASINVSFFMMNDKAYSADLKSRTITVRGEVRYNITIKERKEYKIGVLFSDLSDDNRNFIREFTVSNK
ncbi:MAG: PilZ domain-containing protein [Candidatus Omnitrophota bacterium]